MNITFYGYNTFIIEWEDKKIAIDPGGSFYLPDFFKTLIPKSEWPGVTHIFVTHGDPDHHWHTDRMAKVSNAKVICNERMVRDVNGERLMLGPRSKGLTFNAPIQNLYLVELDQKIELDGMHITGIKGTHGPLTIKMGPFSKTLHEGPTERMGYGEMGFQISYQERTIINLGDTILHEKEWQQLDPPYILMLPIGGKIPGNTMDEIDALRAVEIIQPEIVIPVHYNCPGLFNKCYNPADSKMFQQEIDKMNIRCIIMKEGDSITI